MLMQDERDLISTKEAAQLTGYVQEYIRDLARNGVIAGRKYGSAWMIYRQSLLDYKRSQDLHRQNRGSSGW